jgi:sulfhydrogenase subunit delta
MNTKPRVAIYKFTSCSGCQQALLDAERELPDIFEAIDVVYFVEGQSVNEDGPYDLALVEGSISRSEEIESVKELRAQAKILIAMGACAVYGGPQALRNWADMRHLKDASYTQPNEIKALDWTGGIATYVAVDYRVFGCGPNPIQLVEVITNFLQGDTPALPHHSVCVECKMAGNICLLVAGGKNCMGPVTVAGCGAACPSHKRGCYGCFGPMIAPNVMALARVFETLGNSAEDIVRIFRNQSSNAPAFREVAQVYAQKRRLAA